ncbi:MAG TPA: Ig-like domain-containing protein [Candidatus Lokiarchaeia archaeon]|nr:Ig-like domain-containing protein [Candidatus Lokiarchaeia archaeon]
MIENRKTWMMACVVSIILASIVLSARYSRQDNPRFTSEGLVGHQIAPSDSSSLDLPPRTYTEGAYEASYGDHVSGSIRFSNFGAPITFMIMDQNAFDAFTYGYSYTPAYKQSNVFSLDWTFTVPYYGLWYWVYVNYSPVYDATGTISFYYDSPPTIACNVTDGTIVDNSLHVKANASAYAGGRISSISMLVNGNVIASNASDNLEFCFVPGPLNSPSTTITFEAWDNLGQSSSVRINIIVPDRWNPILTWASNETRACMVYAIAVFTSDNVGIARVDFWVDGRLVDQEFDPSTTQVIYDWDSTTVQNGTANITVIAYDAAGNHVNITRQILVDNDHTAPVLEWVSVPGVVTDSCNLQYRVMDDRGVVSLVISIDGNVIKVLNGSYTDSVLDLTWDTSTIVNSMENVTIVGRDAAGNTCTISILIHVDNSIRFAMIWLGVTSAVVLIMGFIMRKKLGKQANLHASLLRKRKTPGEIPYKQKLLAKRD